MSSNYLCDKCSQTLDINYRNTCNCWMQRREHRKVTIPDGFDGDAKSLCPRYETDGDEDND